MTRRPALALIATLATLVPAVAAPAAQAAPTRTAQAFVNAFKAAEVESRAAAAAVEPALKKIEPCLDVVTKAPAKQTFEALTLGLSAAIGEGFVAPLLPVVTRLQAALDAIPTQDPVLRSARATWRAQIGVFTSYPSGTATCDALAAWQAAGWKRSAQPDVEGLAGGADVSEKQEDAYERRLARGVRRLRALGVSKRDAARIEGEDFGEPVAERFSQLIEPLFDAIGPSGSDREGDWLNR